MTFTVSHQLLAQPSAVQKTTFSYTGAAQDYVVPAGVTTIEFKAWGAAGGGTTAGGGAFSWSKSISVTPGETLQVFVGGGGAAGFDLGAYIGGGGGWTHLARTGTILCGAAAGSGASNVAGVPGGTTEGFDGNWNIEVGQSGKKGTQSAGGAGGLNAQAGSLGNGGDAVATGGTSGAGGFNGGGDGGWSPAPKNQIMSGGGAGYYGGGGAGQTVADGGGGASGGSGSSLTLGGGPAEAGSGTSVGGSSDPDYPGGVGNANPVAGGTGENGYAVILAL